MIGRAVSILLGITLNPLAGPDLKAAAMLMLAMSAAATIFAGYGLIALILQTVIR